MMALLTIFSLSSFCQFVGQIYVVFDAEISSETMPHVYDLPDDNEIDVPLVPLSTAVLFAGAHHLGKQCQNANAQFMLCKEEERDPRKCLKEGREVSRCVTDFFGTIKANCAEAFTEYMNCIDYNEFRFQDCRKHQAVFDKCVKEKLGWERPELGYLSKPAIIKTDRPLPIKELRPKKEPDYIPKLPPDDQLPAENKGSRFHFW